MNRISAVLLSTLASCASTAIADNVFVFPSGFAGGYELHVNSAFYANVNGVQTHFYNVTFSGRAISSLPQLNMYADSENIGIGTCSVYVYEDPSNPPRSITAVNITPNTTSTGGPFYLRQVRGVYQGTGSRPLSVTLTSVGSVGYIDNVFSNPPAVVPADIVASQVGGISTRFSSADSMSGDCYVNVTTSGGTIYNGTLTGAMANASIQGRLWGTLNVIGGINNISVSKQIGLAPTESVSVPSRLLRIISPSIAQLVGERIYAQLNNGSASAPTSVNLINATGNPSTSDTDAGGVFGSYSISSLAASSSVPSPSIIASSDLGATITFVTALPFNSIVNPPIYVGRTFRSGASIAIPAGGLTDQIVINAKGLSGQWLGAISVAGTPISQTTSSSGIYLLPSDSYGGGAVGLVPFKFYAADSTNAIYGSSGLNDGVLLDSDFNRTHMPSNPLTMSFYGPVKKSAAATPVTVMLVSPTSGMSIDVTNRVSVTIDSASPRDVQIQPAAGYEYSFMPGRYVVQNNSTGSKLLCDVVPSTPAIPVSLPDGFTFDLGRDLNHDGVLDRDQISSLCTLIPDEFGGHWSNCDCPDKNGNGVLDEYETGLECLADLNGDGLVNDADFSLFVIAYNNVFDYRGDINGDSITDDRDFSIFAFLYNELDCDLIFTFPCGS